jgi:cysteine desulfurase/selenocysteine lyase
MSGTRSVHDTPAAGAAPAANPVSAAAPAYDVQAIRRDFPALHQQVHGKPLVYLDNAATTHKPRQVLDAIVGFYTRDNSNVHRGVHELSVRATDSYEGAREKIRQFIGAASEREIVFVRGTTEGINLAARCFVGPRLEADDEILVTALEHHSDIVPWQMLCEKTGAVLRVVPIDDAGAVHLEEFEKLLGPRTRFVALSYVSNALGTILPVKAMVARAHAHGVPVLVDAAQAVPHLHVDVQDLDCDFLVFSGHKLYGPTGIGVLYGKRAHLEAMPPWQGGGDMISSVTFEKSTWNRLPWKFEAGTPDIAGAIGLGAAIDYVQAIGLDAIAAHEAELLRRATAAVGALPGVRLLGTAPQKGAVLSFVIDGIHPHDIGTILDRLGIAIRTGHHCAQPVMERFGVPATARASFALYNTPDEIDALAAGVRQVIEMLGPVER